MYDCIPESPFAALSPVARSVLKITWTNEDGLPIDEDGLLWLQSTTEAIKIRINVDRSTIYHKIYLSEGPSQLQKREFKKVRTSLYLGN